MLGPFVESDRKDDDETDDRGLPERGYSEQDQSVSQDADNQDAENGTEDRAFAAGERCPSDDCGSDDIKFQSYTGPAGLAAGQKGETQYSGQRAQKSHEGKGQDFCLKDLDSGEPGRFLASADGVDPKAKGRFRKEKPCGECDQDEKDQQHRDTIKKVALTQKIKLIDDILAAAFGGVHGDRFSVGHQQGSAAYHAQHSKRGDE